MLVISNWITDQPISRMIDPVGIGRMPEAEHGTGPGPHIAQSVRLKISSVTDKGIIKRRQEVRLFY